MHHRPVRLPIRVGMLVPAREQQRVHLDIVRIRHVPYETPASAAALNVIATLSRDAPKARAMARPDNPWACRASTLFALILRTI